MVDVVAVMKWDRVVPWKVLSLAVCDERDLVPAGYGFCAFPQRLTKGSKLWVVTRRNPRDCYSLLARIAVADICEPDSLFSEWPKETHKMLKKWKTLAVADPGKSRFFPMNDANKDLDDLGIRFYGPFAYAKRSTRAFARAQRQALQTTFVTYKWQDDDGFAIALAAALRDEKLSPWFDGMAIPGFDEKRDLPGGSRLETLIDRGAGDCKFAVIVNTPNFAKKGWTLKEWRRIRDRGIPCFQVMRGGTAKEGAIQIADGSPRKVASAIRRGLQHV